MPEVRENSSTMEHSAASVNGNQGNCHMQSPTSLSSTSFVDPRRIQSSTKEQNAEPITETKNVSPQSSDVLQRARTAITAAERASAAARAAAELVNARFPSFKLEERKI